MKLDIHIVLTFLTAMAISTATARELKDVELKSGPTETSVKVFFTGTREENPYPLYFQKFDASKQTLTLSFLETETLIPLGRHTLQPGSPGIEELQLRKMTSPSGKVFLGLELKVLEPIADEVKVEPIPKGGLKISLGPGSKKKWTWSLAKSIQDREAYLSAKAEAPPKALKEPLATPETITKPEAVTKPEVVSVDSFPAALSSAHESGAKLEAAQGQQALSLSRVFSIGESGKPMVILKDSSEMKDRAGAEGKVMKKIPLGTKVLRLEGKEGWIKIVDGMDTGFVRSKGAVYVDEMSESQQKTLQSGLAAKEAKLLSQAEAIRKKTEAEALAASVAAELAVKEAGKAPPQSASPGDVPTLSIAGNPEFAEKLASEKKTADEEKLRIEPEEKRVTYNSYGRRDPFIPVNQGSLDNGIDIDQMKVVGIIWQASEPLAVLEHTREANVSYTVKQGDPIHNGRVGKITREAVTFDISEYGISRSYSLKLVSSKEGTKK